VLGRTRCLGRATSGQDAHHEGDHAAHSGPTLHGPHPGKLRVGSSGLDLTARPFLAVIHRRLPLMMPSDRRGNAHYGNAQVVPDLEYLSVIARHHPARNCREGKWHQWRRLHEFLSGSPSCPPIVLGCDPRGCRQPLIRTAGSSTRRKPIGRGRSVKRSSTFRQHLPATDLASCQYRRLHESEHLNIDSAPREVRGPEDSYSLCNEFDPHRPHESGVAKKGR
jgi:hypothetical protein